MRPPQRLARHDGHRSALRLRTHASGLTAVDRTDLGSKPHPGVPSRPPGRPRRPAIPPALSERSEAQKRFPVVRRLGMRSHSQNHAHRMPRCVVVMRTRLGVAARRCQAIVAQRVLTEEGRRSSLRGGRVVQPGVQQAVAGKPKVANPRAVPSHSKANRFTIGSDLRTRDTGTGESSLRPRQGRSTAHQYGRTVPRNSASDIRSLRELPVPRPATRWTAQKHGCPESSQSLAPHRDGSGVSPSHRRARGEQGSPPKG